MRWVCQKSLEAAERLSKANMTDLKNIPNYVPGHGLLKGKRVVITAAAGTGIGFAAAKKCIEEGALVFISDIHEGLPAI